MYCSVTQHTIMRVYRVCVDIYIYIYIHTHIWAPGVQHGPGAQGRRGHRRPRPGVVVLIGLIVVSLIASSIMIDIVSIFAIIVIAVIIISSSSSSSIVIISIIVIVNIDIYFIVIVIIAPEQRGLAGCARRRHVYDTTL